MKKTLHLLIGLLFCTLNYGQVISIIGNNGPAASWGIDTDMATTDNITYTLNNVILTTATDPATTGLKFRLDHDWVTNWGNSNWPSGTAVQNGANIMTVAGTYDITFNRINGTYTFIPSPVVHNIGIWGPAVDSQNGFGGADVNMTTTDGINYTLSGFYFSSGTAYFRENDATINVWGSVSFPTGSAFLGGPSIQVTGGEWFVRFNRLSGDYSFSYPGIGILGTALNGFNVDDTDLATTDGFEYTINGLALTDGLVKFRKDNLWDTNWGSTGFPSATGIQNGPDIPVTAGTYDIVFQKSSGHYLFTDTLSTIENSIANLKIYPNPTSNIWNLSHLTTIDSIALFDITGKIIKTYYPNANQFPLDGSSLSNGVYFIKIKSGSDFAVQKIIRN
jgi:hypothetical protein